MIGPGSMQAAILSEIGRPLVVAAVGLPEALDAGQVLVKVHYSGICGSQLGEIDGAKGEDRFLPHLLGHEGSGTVLETGAGVRHVKKGDTVVLHWRKGLGIESATPAYTWNGRRVNAGWVTTFNEYAIVSENRLTAIPPGSDLRIAALLGCAVTTGFGVVTNNAKLRIGESVVVYGAGGVGLNIVQAAGLAGAYPVIAVDRYDNRLALASAMGATHCVNAARQGAEAAILAALGTQALDCFIDNTGVPSIIELGFRMTNPRGRVTLVGVPRKGEDITVHSLPLHFGKSLSGSHGGEAEPHEDIPRYLNLLAAGRLRLAEQITGVYPLADVNAAIEDMRSGQASGRSLLRLGST